MSLHPVDQLARIEAAAAELRALIASDREARVGATHHAVVTRVDDRDLVHVEPLPGLAEVLALLAGPVVVVDTETTGLHVHNGDRLVSAAFLPVKAEAAAGEARTCLAPFRFTVNPRRPSSPEALAVHGMTERELALMPPLSAPIATQALRFLGRATVVAHNAPFDVGFLQAEFGRVGAEAELWSNPTVDTRLVSKLLWPGERGSLDALAERLGVDRGDRDARHDALGDARLLARCLPGLVAAIRERIA